ncbi:MAG TPA: pyridoxamine 5'-phosphate oxidase family protein [Gemmatimonadaceae bacterium]|nr:pyridoxamine 5'-phosphate oxidase family protein [Gemmatimonadaceae bacterium]
MSHHTRTPARATPRFRTLTTTECESLLRRAKVGRIAYAFRDRVDIEPIHFVYRDGWVVWRTAPGAKLETLEHNRWVAFEVDEVRGVFDWRSVVLHGSAYPLDEVADAVLPRARAEALALLRRIVPGTGTAADPVPWRSRVYHMQVERMSGRASTTRPLARERPAASRRRRVLVP